MFSSSTDLQAAYFQSECLVVREQLLQPPACRHTREQMEVLEVSVETVQNEPFGHILHFAPRPNIH